jgi:hypothetical protein
MSETRWAWIVSLGLCWACGGSTEFDRSKSDAAPAPCNDLQAIEVDPTCVPLAEVATPTGGPIADGVYVLVEYATAGCNLGLRRTSRISWLSEDTYDLELVLPQPDSRANATFVTSGTSITSTYTCGGSQDPPLQYAITDGPDGYRFSVIAESSALVYQRFGD